MILCCGEALVDMIPAATADGGTGFVPHPGGAVFNTARALGRLGLPAALLTGLSTDLFGQQLDAALRDSGVDAALSIRSDRPTTLAFVSLVDGQARYHFLDENSAGRMLSPADMPALPKSVDTLFFGGISLACEPGAEAYAGLLGRAGPSRAVMIDPNIRPGFVADADRYRRRLDAMLARADIVKLSAEDLDWLQPGPAERLDKLATLPGAAGRLSILTDGARGATALPPAGGAPIRVPARPVARVADTVGAGDSFNAGVLAGLWRQGHRDRAAIRALGRADIEAALDFGARVAAATVARPGADPPWAAELGG
jgi:fructokinase